MLISTSFDKLLFSGIENCCPILTTIGWEAAPDNQNDTQLVIHNFSHLVSTSPVSDLNTMGIYHIFIVSKSGGLIFNYDHKVCTLKCFSFSKFLNCVLRCRRLSMRRPTATLLTSSSNLRTSGSRY